MSISRRKFLSWLGAAGVAGTVGRTPAHAASNKEFKGYPDSKAVLHDVTRCIGCRKCEAACNQVNALPAPDKPFDDLSVLTQKRRTTAKTYTVVNQFFPAAVRSLPKNSATTAWSRPAPRPASSRLSPKRPKARWSTTPTCAWAAAIA